MVTSLRTELNPVHQTSAEDVDADIDYEVMKTALQREGGEGVCLQQLAVGVFSILDVFNLLVLSFLFFVFFLSFFFLLTAVFLFDR